MSQSSLLEFGSDTTTEILARAVRGRETSPFEERLVDVLHDDVFRQVPDLKPTEQCALSYRRMRHLRRRLNLRAADLFADVDSMLALHDWTCLVDGTLTTLLTIHYNLCIGSVVQHGEGRPELEPYLAELERMDSIGVFLATELGYGNNVQALETEAVYDHATRTFVVHTPSPQARKFMPNTGAEGIAKIAVVMARLKVSGKSCGVFPFVVRLRTAQGLCPGVRIVPLGDKPDYGLDNAMTAFEKVRIPFSDWLSGSESRIDEAGTFASTVTSAGRRFLSAMDRVQAGKLCLSVAALSMMRASLRIALDYSQQRKSFAPGRRSVSILSYRPYQRVMFEGVATSYAAAYLLESVADRFRTRTYGEDAETDRLLALGKVFVSSRALRIASRCREKVGAQGMFSANRIIDYWVGINGIVTAEGDNEILLVRAAREILIGYAYEPIPRTPAPAPATLESPEYLVHVVRERERTLREQILASGAAMNPAGGVFQVWNAHLSESIELASVHALRVAMEHFAEGIARLNPTTDEAEAARTTLTRLFRLFALAEMAAFMPSLLLDGILDAELAARFHAAREALAGELFDDARVLTEAFALPNSILEAPIVGDYLAAYGAHASEEDDESPRHSFIRGVFSAASSGS